MRSSTAILSLVALLAAPIDRAESQDPLNDPQVAEAWTSQELENLLAPIALYPDPILAQVLIAATFPDQIAEAAAYVRTNGTRGIDDQTWEISVKAVAHYAPVLNLMAEGEDWTVALGQAYTAQPADVMGAVQSLRRMANAQGNLESTLQQTVYVEKEVIKIIPAEPKVIYVPTYDPAVVYFRPVYVAHAHPAYWSWGVAYPIGVWLTYDLDWHSHRVYYHGWHGPRWVVVSRPWIVINPIYVAPRHTVIYVNRGIGRRHINYDRLRRHTVVHRGATFDRRREWDRGREPVRADRGPDRRDNDRFDRRDDRRRATPTPTRATPTRGNIVPTRTWASRTGGTLSTRTTPTRAEPTRPTPGSSPRRDNTPRDNTPRGNSPRDDDRSAPRAPNRGTSPVKAAPSRDRVVKTPAWSSGRAPGSAATPRTTTRTAAPTRTRTTTTPRSTPSTTTRPSAAPSTERKRIVPPGRAASARNSASTPRASASTPRSSSTPRASGGTPRSSSTPRASSGSRSRGSSAPARSSSRTGGERKRP